MPVKGLVLRLPKFVNDMGQGKTAAARVIATLGGLAECRCLPKIMKFGCGGPWTTGRTASVGGFAMQHDRPRLSKAAAGCTAYEGGLADCREDVEVVGLGGGMLQQLPAGDFPKWLLQEALHSGGFADAI